MNGKVLNAMTKQPIKLVNVKIQNSNIGTITNADGTYQLPDLNGNGLVSFSHIGFDTFITPYNKDFYNIIELNPISYTLPSISIKPKENFATNLALLLSGFFLLSSSIFKKSK